MRSAQAKKRLDGTPTERNLGWALASAILAAMTAQARQTTLRWRATQVSSTSPPSRFHQFSAEKISTSL
jgi:hypothetical protein